MTTLNTYEEIAERNLVRRGRDLLFALALAATAAFSLTSIGTAAHASTPVAAAPAPACAPVAAC